jgi:hypothetical protein
MHKIRTWQYKKAIAISPQQNFQWDINLTLNLKKFLNGLLTGCTAQTPYRSDIKFPFFSPIVTKSFHQLPPTGAPKRGDAK